MDPQVALSKALENRNVKEFRLAIDMDGDPSRMDDKHLSIFERALTSFGCADIVAECLQKGCKVDYVSILLFLGLSSYKLIFWHSFVLSVSTFVLKYQLLTGLLINLPDEPERQCFIRYNDTILE